MNISVAKVKRDGRKAEKRAIKDLQRLNSEIAWENYKKSLFNEFVGVNSEKKANNIIFKIEF